MQRAAGLTALHNNIVTCSTSLLFACLRAAAPVPGQVAAPVAALVGAHVDAPVDAAPAARASAPTAIFRTPPPASGASSAF